MLKTVLLASTLTFATPAVAQTAPAQQQPATTAAQPAAPAQTAATPQTTAPTAATAPSPAPVSAQAAPAPASPATPAAQQSAATTPAAGGDQVAQIVNTEFASYDKNGDGSLDKTEFAAWMTALKSADPTAKGQTPDAKWNDAAFAQADADKSKAVSKTELTGFLGGAAKQAS